MDEGKKRKIMVGVIVGCLVLAGVMTIVSMGSSKPKKSNDPFLVVCCNSSCKASYELKPEEYRDLIKSDQKGMDPRMIMGMVPVTCKECGEKSAYKAIRCEKCGFVFPRGLNPEDFSDRCPKCGYSKTEERRNNK